MFSKKSSRSYKLGLLFFILCFSFVSLYTVILKTHPTRHYDGRFIYIAGLCWLSGQSPYHFVTFSERWRQNMSHEIMHPELPKGFGAFVYPPAFGILALPVGLLPSWEIAKYGLDGINLLLLLATVFFTLALIRQYALSSAHLDKLWFGVGIACLSTGVTATLHFAQTSLFAVTGCLGAIYFAKNQRPLLAMLFIIIASTKPQLALLPLTFLFIHWGNWRLLGYAVVGVGLTNLSFLLLGGDSNPWALLQATSTTYAGLKPNLDTIWGLRGLLDMTSVGAIVSFAILGLIALLMATRLNQSQTLYGLMLPFVLTAVCMPGHHYDYVVFFLLFTAMVILPWSALGWLLPGGILVFRPDSLAALHSQWIFGYISRPAIDSLMPIIGSSGALYLCLVLLSTPWSIRSSPRFQD